jgi:DNA-binding XRE family transcriptional regulator
MKGKDLKILRLLHNIQTQAGLAKIMNVNPRTIVEWEKSDQVLSPRIVSKLKDKLNVELYDTFKDKFYQY